MKKSVIISALLLTVLVVLIAACSNAATPTAASDPATSEASSATSDNSSAASDEEVKALIEERCSSCHNTGIIYNANFDESRWSDVIDQMIQKGADLSDSEKALLIEWLIAQP